MRKQRLAISFLLVLPVLGMKCSPEIPDFCGDNVKKVLTLDFSGPSNISQGADPETQSPSAGYDVTVSIEKFDNNAQSNVCFAVRDDDPATKLFWAVDDVLDAAFVTIPDDRTRITAEGAFVLIAQNRKNVCGWGTLPGELKISGCSGEKEAEVYLDLRGAPGPNSSKKKIKAK